VCRDIQRSALKERRIYFSPAWPSVTPCEAALRSVTARQPEFGHVAALAATPQQRARVIDALRSRAKLTFVSSFNELLTLLRSTLAAVDVVIVPGREGGVVADRTVRAIATERPGAAIVAWCTAQQSTDFGSLAAAGVHQFVIAGLNDTGVILREVVDAARRASAAEQVMNQLASAIPATMHPVAEAILTKPDTITSIHDIASELGIHRKTLFNWARRTGSLAPAELLAWCRLALVAHHLANTGCTVETIAVELAYPSPTALRNTIKRYTGMTASELRRRDPSACVLGALKKRLSA
jgi:AraC-like DNA-binding protein